MLLIAGAIYLGIAVVVMFAIAFAASDRTIDHDEAILSGLDIIELNDLHDGASLDEAFSYTIIEGQTAATTTTAVGREAASQRNG